MNQYLTDGLIQFDWWKALSALCCTKIQTCPLRQKCSSAQNNQPRGV